MSIELEQRVRAAVRDLAGAVPVVPPSPAAVRARSRTRTRAAGQAGHRPAARWLAPALAAAAVLTLVAVVAVVPGWFGSPAPSDPAGTDSRPVLPERFASASRLTASVADSPPGLAIATFTQLVGDTEVLVVVGTDGRTYRRLDRGELLELSHNRAHSVRDPVLSPDGSRLAGDGGYLIDLATGEGEWFPLLASDRRDSWGALPFLGWSPDSQLLAYLHTDGMLLYDTDSGDSEVLAVGQPGGGFAFSPDGQQLAVGTDPGGTIAVVDRSGNLLRELDLRPGQWLAGRGTGWSPDGSALAVHNGPAGIAPMDADSGEGLVGSVSFSWGRVELLGWQSPDIMLVGLWPDSSDELNPVKIYEVGPDRAIERAWLPDQVEPGASFHLAGGLLPDTEFRDIEPPARPLPLAAVWAAGLAAASGLLILAVIVRRRRRGRAVAA